MIVLGIETSCDETAAGIVDDRRALRANVVLSQLDRHRPYGGIVPEIAARAHVETIDTVVRRALADAGLGLAALDGVAATAGPGLIGGVIVGATFGKALAAARGLPFSAVNHLEGHALTARLTDDVAFPYLLLLATGGHCQLLLVEGVGRYVRLGTTVDDAVGEAFDKTARMLGLGYPGGPEVERAAVAGDPLRFALPRPMAGRAGCDFSFSGLKTAVRHAVEALPPGPLGREDVADLSAGFQAAVTDCVLDRTEHAVALARRCAPSVASLVVAGGVAANGALRTALAGLAAAHGLEFVAPPPALCTDNGAMIAWAGLERLRLGLADPLDFAPRPRWPLEAPAETSGDGKRAVRR